MKKILLILLITVSTINLFAQTNETKDNKNNEQQTLLSGPISFGGWGGPEVKYTKFKGKEGLLVGGKGGVIINHFFTFGGGGCGLVTNHKFDAKYPNTNTDTTLNLQLGYGGVYMEFTPLSKKLIHVSIPVLIGAGGATLSTNDNYHKYRNNNNIDNYNYADNTAFFIIEPGLNVELNVAQFFRIDMGVNYRAILGSDIVYFKDKDLSGLSYNLILKFGLF